MASSKWKDYLLKTSLPLEVRVAEVLGDSGFWVGGEFPYLRTNEEGERTEFSVDVHAAYEFDHDENWVATWELLVECKYSAPGVQLVFSPFPEVADVILGTIWVTEDYTTLRFTDKDPMQSVDCNNRYCMRGVKIHRNGYDEHSLTRGLNQLRYGMPQLIARDVSQQLKTRKDIDLHAVLSTPILVTTAPLFVLSNDASLEDFQKADEMEDIADEVDSLIAYQPISPELKLYTEALIQRHKLKSSARSRAEKLREVMKQKDYDRHLLPRESHVQTSIAGSSERVLVVNFESLPSVLDNLTGLIEEAKASIEHFAKLDYDQKNGDDVITPLR